MIVVSDSSPLVALIDIDQVSLLPRLYERVLVPEAVWRETFVQGEGRPGREEVARAPWLERRSVVDTLAVRALQEGLDAGESEAIALAVEAKADLLLMDERLGRRTAQHMGLKVAGVIGVLVDAKHKGMVPAIRPQLDALRDRAGFRVSDELYRRVIMDERE